MTTSIRLSRYTREKLVALKASRRETYDEMLNRLISLVPTGDEEGLYPNAFRTGLLNARLDIREGRVEKGDLVMERLDL